MTKVASSALCLIALFAILAPNRADAQSRYVTWVADGDRVWSAWLVADDEATYEVVAEREGLWLGSPDGLWEATEVARPGRELFCQCEGWDGFSEPPDACIYDVPVVTPGLVHLDDGIDLRADADAADLTTWGQSHRSWTLRGTVGPLVFLERCIDETACGSAHPSTTCRFELWNIALQSPVPIDEIFDDGRVPDVLYDRAMAAFAARDGVHIEPGEVFATAARVAWDAEGALRLFVQFTMPASYADSDGSWSSYSRSLELEAELPELLRTQRHTPDAVRGFWADRVAPGTQRGWSRIPAP